MKRFIIFLMVAIALISISAHAGRYPYQIYDGEPIDSGKANTPQLECYATESVLTPILADTDYVHAAITQTAAAQTITTAITNPDVPRNVTIKGSASGITGDVVINGTNVRGDTISETIALSGASAVAGTKAFQTVTSVVVPIKTHTSGDTVEIGIGSKIGVRHKLYSTAQFILSLFDGSVDVGSVTVSATDVSLNTYTPAGTLDGTKKLRLLYIIMPSTGK